MSICDVNLHNLSLQKYYLYSFTRKIAAILPEYALDNLPENKESAPLGNL